MRTQLKPYRGNDAEMLGNTGLPDVITRDRFVIAAG